MLLSASVRLLPAVSRTSRAEDRHARFVTTRGLEARIRATDAVLIDDSHKEWHYRDGRYDSDDGKRSDVFK
jgi:hypothetical protein